MPTHLSDEQAQFVEEIGLLMEEHGRTRIAGKILGWLLICEPPQQSFAALVDVLGASKGSISSMTTLLLEAKLIERVAMPGDRQTYYQMAPDAWSLVLSRMAERIQRSVEAAEAGLALVERLHPEADHWRLREMRELNRIAAEGFPAFVEKFEASRRA